MLARIQANLNTVGTSTDAAEDERLAQTMLVAFAVMIATFAFIWGLVYIAFDEPVAAAIPLTYSGLSALSLAVFAATRRYHFFRASQLLLGLLLPFFLSIALGGFVSSSMVIIWSLTSPIGAFVFAGRRQAWFWFVLYIIVLAIAVLLEPFVVRDNNLPSWLNTTFFFLNLAVVSTVVMVLLSFFTRQRERAVDLLRIEQDKSERLLLNVLPASIAARLKEEDHIIAERYDSISVLFADIVGYTPFSESVSDATLVVGMLNEIYSAWDAIGDTYGLEKIRTMGDAYMVAAGVPDERPDHAQALAAAGLDMMAFLDTWNSPYAEQVQFRMGINSGPVTAGVIGRRKFSYDVWGDTVNVASRMESHGLPGRIQITPATNELIVQDFLTESRGIVAIKGKGEMETFFLIDKQDGR